jgi:tetratricopeptide (TPR) repeat protein
MLVRFRNCWGVFALALAVFVGCQATGPASKVAAPARQRAKSPATARVAEPARPSEQLVQAHAFYAAAIIDEMNDAPDAATEAFTLAALHDPENEALTLDITRRLLQRNQPDKALRLLTNAVARAGASGELYARLGQVYGQLGQTNLALEAARIAIKKSPRLLAGYRRLFLAGLQDKQPEEARKVLDQARKQTDTSAEFLVDLSELYAALGRQFPTQEVEAKADALSVLDRVVKLNPTDPDLRLKLADGFNLFGQPDKAAPIYLDLLKTYPESPTVRGAVRAKLIDVYLRGRDRGRATEQLEAVVRDEPNNAQAYYILGSLAYEEKKMDRAAEYFAKAILFSPDWEQAYYDLTGAQISLNQGTEALATLDKARSKFGDNFVIQYLSGTAHRVLKDYAAAINCFTAAEVIAQATDRKRLNEFLYFQIGATYERKGDIAQAVSYLEKALSIAPNFAEALNYLGYTWADRGENLERARELIEKAVQLEPKNAAYLDSLGWVLFRLGQPQQALGHLQEAIQLSPEPDATVLDHLGDVLSALDQPAKARDAWQKSLSLEPNEKVKVKLDQPASN